VFWFGAAIATGTWIGLFSIRERYNPAVCRILCIVYAVGFGLMAFGLREQGFFAKGSWIETGAILLLGTMAVGALFEARKKMPLVRWTKSKR
jgi:hypothetical protein